jgi:predicted regulator of Ras-like GTPase activity (Roadblock/LC7/MglB family)
VSDSQSTIAQYESVLNECLERIPGAVAASVVGLDGISLISVTNDDNHNTELADAEVALMLAMSDKATSGMEIGRMEEMIATAEQATVVARLLRKEFYLTLVMKGEQLNLGLARLELTRVSSTFEEMIPA